MQTKLLSVLAILSVLVTGAALADGFKPAVVYDIGGKFDKSFNESVWNGVRKFTGRPVSRSRSSRSPTRPSVSRRCAASSNAARPW